MNLKADKSNLLNLAERACETLMRKFDAPLLPPVDHFHYHQGVFLSGVCKTWQLTGKQKYFDYMKAWVDRYILQDGNIDDFNSGHLDDLQPGILLYPLYRETGDERYRLASDTIAWYVSHMAVTPEGGFWHKSHLRNQMWLDGLYMGGPVLMEYAVLNHREDLIDLIVKQVRLMKKNTRDEKTGLWYHAWDYEKRQPWADPVTGKSPEFWGRSMGWVPVALMEEYELLPENHPARKELGETACELLEALIPWQDSESGLWYQVVNKGGQPGNWLESSCTCLYTAAICMCVRNGLMSTDKLEIVRNAAQGIINRLGEDEKGLLIGGVCIGTGVGDYPFYCARPTSVNDLHGVGAFLLMCTEASRVL